MFTRICEPVAFAHARGIVHRDLKPENVMIGEFGEVLVMDWGVAKLLRDDGGSPEAARSHGLEQVASGDRLTSDGDVIGTRGYMAPEQERGDTSAIGPRTDVWALGAILRELASATAAREGTRLPKPLAAIIATATAGLTRPAVRVRRELAADVVRFADGNASPPTASPHGSASRGGCEGTGLRSRSSSPTSSCGRSSISGSGDKAEQVQGNAKTIS